MTQKELEQLKPLNQEILYQQKRLKEWEALASGKVRTIEGIPTISPQQKTAEIEREIELLKEQIAQNLKKCFRMVREMQEFIDGVGDSEMRMILSLRYLNGLTWSQVAFSIGEYDEQYPRRRNNRFFKEQRDEKNT
ncbi:DUF1492 domain-containing protein [Acidaminobacterium chupaoyuni]